MIRIPGKFIYLCSPRTASRSTADALIKQCGGQKLINSHHAMPADEARLREFDEPVVAMLRNPYDWLMAQYARHWISRTPKKREPMWTWLSHFNADLIGFGNGRISPYHEWVDEYYLYENGVEAFLKACGLRGVEVPKIGTRGTPEHPVKVESIYPDCRALIDKKYAKDITLYNWWRERWHGLKQAI
jgi:hypothetical protein